MKNPSDKGQINIPREKLFKEFTEEDRKGITAELEQGVAIENAASKILNSYALQKMLNQYLFYTKEEIENEISRSDLPALNLICLRIIIKAVNMGDPGRINLILDRTIGKVPLNVNATVSQNINEQIIQRAKEYKAKKIELRRKELGIETVEYKEL